MNSPRLQSWSVRLLPGVAVIASVVLVRLLGVLQPLEWLTLDYGLRLRPPEPMDDRIVIVGINEGDIQSLESYPISDRDLANLLEMLQTYRPRAIGIDIFRDLPVKPGHGALTAAFKQMPNVIAIERILPDSRGFTIAPPPSLPDEQVGFVDALLDSDGFLRRSLLGASSTTDEYRFSLTLRLAEAYLQAEGISIDNGIQDPVAMRFGSTELRRVRPNTGGYVQANAGGNQILLNFRSGLRSFQQVSLRDIQSGAVDPAWFQDRIVLVGVTAPSQKDLINTAAVPGPGFIYGVEIQAHATSQIISAVLDERPLLTAWFDVWEYLWIVLWGGMGLLLGRVTSSPMRHFAIASLLSLGMIGFSYLCLLWGIWTPLVPALLAFGINSIVLYSFYLYDQGLRARIQERQQVIESTFDALHNGPLQTLAVLLRQAKDQGEESHSSGLQNLNRELRDVYEAIRQETVAQGSQLVIGSHLRLNPRTPLHESLYEVYAATLQRDLPCFDGLKVKVVQFDPLDSQRLSPELQRDLCRFLEEALCNVGKYAAGATRLRVECGQECDGLRERSFANGNRNFIRIQDNGAGQLLETASKLLSSQGGRGSQQAETLARQLRGTFQRVPASPKGVICELVWPTKTRPFWAFWRI